jgi:nucleotide-binding universal stress UspA family protein
VLTRSTVTVGSDGSEAGLEAVGWASGYARLWEAPLRIVTVGAGHGDRGPVDDSRRQISREEFQLRQRLEQRSLAALSRAANTLPTELIETLTVTGDPVDALVRAAGQGPLVVGSRGLGLLSGAVAGSVSRRVIGRAHGPVAVVPKAASGRGRRVVAGVDGGASTEAVVSFAFEEARVRGAELLVCRVLPESVRGGRPSDTTTEAVERARVSGRQVRVSSESPTGDPVDLLASRSAQAELVVIGGRGLGPAAGVVRGSVGQRLTLRAKCPVVVIPDRSARG